MISPSTIETLHGKQCSLVLEKDGELHLYYKKGVRDLMNLLDFEPGLLKGSVIADKVIGKAAAGIAAAGGVTEIYADVLSQKAASLLDASGVPYSYAKLVDHIEIPAGDNRCPLEKIVSAEKTAQDVVDSLRTLFSKMG